MAQKKLGDPVAPSLYISASCMDLRYQEQDDEVRHRQSNQHLHPNSQQQQQRAHQQPQSSPLPQTQWTDVPPVYRPRGWVDTNEASPVATRQPRSDPMAAWRARPAPPGQAPSDSRSPERPKKRRGPRIFRRQDTVESPQQQPFDVTMLYPQMSPYDGNRMSTYSAPEQLEHFHNRTISQPNSPGFPPNWSALPSRSDEPSPMGIPRSPTYPPAGRRRMHSTTGVGEAAFDDEQDFRLFVEATAGLPPDIGFSLSQSGQSPTQAQSSQSPLRRAATTQALQRDETSPTAETPTTMLALQELASIPEANQTYRPQRTPQPRQQQTQHQPSFQSRQPQTGIIPQAPQSSSRPQTTRSDSSRDRLAASVSGLDLWLPSPSPISPATPSTSTTTSIPRRQVGSSTERAASVSARAYPDRIVSPLTPPAAPAPLFQSLDDEVERQLRELELEDIEDEEGRRPEYDDELPDYAQSQAEAQASRRAEASRRAQELQERWLRRGW